MATDFDVLPRAKPATEEHDGPENAARQERRRGETERHERDRAGAAKRSLRVAGHHGREVHERRQHDGTHALGHDPTKEERERGNRERQHQQLAQLHADVEREQRRQHVRAGKLQRFA